MRRGMEEIIPDRLSEEEEKKALDRVVEIKERFNSGDPVKIKSENDDKFDTGWIFKHVSTHNEYGRVQPRVLLMSGEKRMLVDPQEFLDWQNE